MSNTTPQTDNGSSRPLATTCLIVTNFAAWIGAIGVTICSPELTTSLTKFGSRISSGGGGGRQAGGGGHGIEMMPLLGGAGGGQNAQAPPAALPDAGGPSLAWRALAVGCYIVYASPNLPGFIDPGKWYTVLNDGITIAAIGKSFTDNCITNAGWAEAAPWLETLLNMIWLVPAVGGYLDSTKSGSDTSGFVGNLAFDVSGILTPSNKTEPGAVAIAALNGIYGVASIAAGVYLIKEN